MGATVILEIGDSLLAPLSFNAQNDIQVTGFLGAISKESFDRNNTSTPFSFTKAVLYASPELAAQAQLAAISTQPAGRQDLKIEVNGQTDSYDLRKASILSLHSYTTVETAGIYLFLEYSMFAGITQLNRRTIDDGTNRTVDDGSTRTMS